MPSAKYKFVTRSVSYCNTADIFFRLSIPVSI
nr:MAG TPA: hypothetical protein [Crassvirales sp.]